MTRDHAYTEIAHVEGASLRLAEATSRETELADHRALVKDAGIKRLMAAGTFGSVTAAEKGIEFDAEYMAHRKLEREAVADRIVMQGKLEAAKLRARLAVEIWAANPDATDGDAEHVIDRIDQMLDDAGVVEKDAQGAFLGISKRIELVLKDPRWTASQGNNGSPAWFEGKVIHGHVDVPDGFEDGDVVTVRKVQ